ncbi:MULTISPECIES: cryptochrome/photolyase family protein [Sphingobium]|uniref:(6-4) photolyase n=1 Tax=Sphingobium fuliginis (strain ATCC 27551) TaxID=336203 RepID=A0ABQ1ES17_SPHSA|nr:MULTISPECIES: cryptochrome/photolyase family protein [Sphingobium]AJR24670.1 deoxyribodipyrimidine photolyase [Sphingobium sp. YBL2]RYL99429.1 cryptochrome/photolyase family protein [Sphingobium fuliginis]WDA36749.1 cryptochrome/photolyase family protein [Sphingobium sp. YC-XJ3]GFZ84735.1 (6-4) photolyase [Sphingobium fuliginis]
MAAPLLIPILGDQLTPGIASLRNADPASSILLMMEVADETTYVRHHKAKIAFILSAMRHHADRLRALGWTVDYVKLDQPENSGSFTGEVARAVARHRPSAIHVTEGGEWRVRAMLEEWEGRFGIPVTIHEDDRFLCSHAEFDAWAAARQQLRMEFFYRDMRRRTGLLLTEEGEPEGGQWNFDAENRKPPPRRDLLMPQPLRFRPDPITQDVLALVAARFSDHIGSLDHFHFAVTHEDAQRQQDHFLDQALPRFGDYQDAMLTDEPFLWHSVLSPYINAGLLDPLSLCRAVEGRYRAGRVPLNAAEGFIRQVIGWREYVRGVYWHEGPGYGRRNALDAKRDLPGFYWTGKTDMHCMARAVGQTIDHAYAHHIQRLMITGNFALLAGIAPVQVHVWYLEVYADAYEWVEMPNTIGMALFADGGLLGSKPYAAGGAYINRMSDYCGRCRYDVKQRLGEDACPFNALYWDFLARNERKLARNPRLAMPYRNWNRMSVEDRAALRKQAARFLDGLGTG